MSAAGVNRGHGLYGPRSGAAR
ncbi:hypothetical protein PSCLAVI8L_70022 [Pseudoclavibacter sp. 8L]|nr:hypothetical protein PSCLAVI8L_70022 [Pseudoclavibacter sp. 8L]